MDLTDPTRAITGTLDGPVLAVLARAGRPLTVGEIASETARGSEIGVRKSLARLVDQGTVRATVAGRNRVHELNRQHLAAPIADLLAGLRLELWRRFRQTLGSWTPRPVHASIFGSAARGDGGPESDIDLLLVHPPFPGEEPVHRSLGNTVIIAASSLLTAMANVHTTPADPAAWHLQVDRLRGLVQTWTGNRLQVVELGIYEWYEPPDETLALLEEIKREGVELIQPLISSSRT